MQDRFRFRGQAKNGKWIFGSLLWYADEPQIWDKDGNNFIVKPETVGQCTGLKDKNGKLIYEGDIIKFINAQPSQVIEICNCGVFFVKRGAFYRCIPLNELPKNITQHSIEYTSGRFGVDMCTGFHFLSGEVIGNIYQNPELLEQ